MSTILERLLGFATSQLYAEYSPNSTTRSRAMPLYKTTSYQFKNIELAANLFAFKELRNIHTHIMDPDAGVLESN